MNAISVSIAALFLLPFVLVKGPSASHSCTAIAPQAAVQDAVFRLSQPAEDIHQQQLFSSMTTCAPDARAVGVNPKSMVKVVGSRPEGTGQSQQDKRVAAGSHGAVNRSTAPAPQLSERQSTYNRCLSSPTLWM